MLSVQETILRAKPATVLVISEVGTEVTLDCGAGQATVTPPPFRETVYDTSPFRIPGAVHVSSEDLDRGTAPPSIEPGRSVIAYCTARDERASVGAVQQLRRLGYATCGC
jgi:hypothetical protein